MSTFDYNTAISQADQISCLGTQLNTQIVQLENLLASVKSGWCGPASDMYQKQLQLLLTDLRQTQSEMNAVSEGIRTAAQRINTP